MSLSSSYPWTTKPLIISAPMAGFATHTLAIAVSRAGGLGFIGSANDMSKLDEELTLARSKLGSLNIGTGFLCFVGDLEAASEVVEKHKPAALWFFAAIKNADYKIWTEKMRSVSPESKIWIQTNSVALAVEIAAECSPDVLVMQGSDAGGHGYEMSCGIISLVPETITALADAGLGHVKIVASGGISDGRSIAAALALGAEGAVMGTRFVASEEIVLPAPGYRNAVLRTQDGGQSTIRDKVFDILRGPNIWPVEYDGRSIMVDSYEDYKNGMGIDEIRNLANEAANTEAKGFSEEKGKARAAIWAGTGVGLVKRVQSAKEIIEDVRNDAIKAIESIRSRI